MKTTVVPTNEYYHRIIDAPDAGARHALYTEYFLEPWQQMFQMAAQGGADTTDDPLAGPRAWSWLLPDQLDTVPESLAALEDANAWAVTASALEQAAGCFEPYAEQAPLEQVEGWLVLADPETSDPVMRGYTGGVDWFAPRFIGQFADPNESNLPRLPGLVTHEMHHLIRLRLFPWSMQTTVADYIVHEGLAESFAASLFGEDAVTYFVSDVPDDDVAAARRAIGEGLQETGFNTVRAYMFGEHWSEKLGLPDVGVPTYGGYAIGYRVVQTFLDRTGESVEAATFLPADEIVERSGYFEA